MFLLPARALARSEGAEHLRKPRRGLAFRCLKSGCSFSEIMCAAGVSPDPSQAMNAVTARVAVRVTAARPEADRKAEAAWRLRPKAGRSRALRPSGMCARHGASRSSCGRKRCASILQGGTGRAVSAGLLCSDLSWARTGRRCTGPSCAQMAQGRRRLSRKGPHSAQRAAARCGSLAGLGRCVFVRASNRCSAPPSFAAILWRALGPRGSRCGCLSAMAPRGRRGFSTLGSILPQAQPREMG